jgi:hypothetical protein
VTYLLLRVTNSAICGSDLHLFLYGMPGINLSLCQPPAAAVAALLLLVAE